MVCRQEVFKVAEPASRTAAGDPVQCARRGRRSGNASGGLGDEHGISRDAAGPSARRDRAYFSDAAGIGGNSRLRSTTAKLAEIPGVRSATPALYETVLMTFGGESRGVVTKGIDPAREETSDEALHKLAAGRLDFQPDQDGIDALLVGKQLADEWKLVPGDYVTLTSPQGRLTPFGLLPRTRRFRVAGIFDSGFYDYDANWCL